MKAFLACGVLFSMLIACSPKREPAESERHYPMSGTVVALDAKLQIATIDAAAIPGFMEAMTMDYPIKSKTEFNALHVGDRIKAIVNVHDDSYSLSKVEKQK